MSKISTQNLSALPDLVILKRLCKSLAALDAVLSPDWEYRYYSYNNAWNDKQTEEYFQMRDGSGDEFHILFSPHGAIINGQAHESVMCRWTTKEIKPVTVKEKLNNLFGQKKTVTEQNIWEGVVDSVPDEFKDFIFGDPIRSTGTTFCIWRKNTDAQWNIGNVLFPEDVYGDGSGDLLYILDHNPETYRKWANEYYEEQFENRTLKLHLIKHVYDFKPITKSFALELNPDLDDFEQLKADLDEIGFPNKGLDS